MCPSDCVGRTALTATPTERSGFADISALSVPELACLPLRMRPARLVRSAFGTQVDVTEAIRASRGGMASFGIMGGKTITTYCSSRFSDRNMRPRLILGIAAQKKEVGAAKQKAKAEL